MDTINHQEDSQPLSPDQVNLLADLARSANDSLETAGSAVTNRAFNLGCFVGMLPATIFVLVTYLVSGFSLAGAAIAAVLMMIGLIIFANLVASISRYNTVQRLYQTKIRSEIEIQLENYGLEQSHFSAITADVLPDQAALRACLATEQSDTPSRSRWMKLPVLGRRP